jgi:hypothetical protein
MLNFVAPRWQSRICPHGAKQIPRRPIKMKSKTHQIVSPVIPELASLAISQSAAASPAATHPGILTAHKGIMPFTVLCIV